MVLLRGVIGDALRGRRQAQHRTLREVSTAANVSLGYLSEIERGQKEASSELLSAICDALGAQLSEVLREASDTMALAEQLERQLADQIDGVLVPMGEPDRGRGRGHDRELTRGRELGRDHDRDLARGRGPSRDGDVDRDRGQERSPSVSVAVHRNGPLKTTLRATRSSTGRGREVVCAA